MKVLLLNGSPKEYGCTYTALSEIAATLMEEGVDSHIYWLGKGPMACCMGCGGCGKTGRCVQDDGVNEVIAMMPEFDGIVLGSPVHFASASGHATAFFDRLFYACPAELLRLKPAAAIVSARRAGTSATLDQLNKYFNIRQMLTVGSQYWPMVHGSTPQDVLEDEEGLQTMRVLAKNMVWLLKNIAAGKAAGVELPEQEARQYTNFIRRTETAAETTAENE